MLEDLLYSCLVFGGKIESIFIKTWSAFKPKFNTLPEKNILYLSYSLNLGIHIEVLKTVVVYRCFLPELVRLGYTIVMSLCMHFENWRSKVLRDVRLGEGECPSGSKG